MTAQDAQQDESVYRTVSPVTSDEEDSIVNNDNDARSEVVQAGRSGESSHTSTRTNDEEYNLYYGDEATTTTAKQDVSGVSCLPRLPLPAIAYDERSHKRTVSEMLEIAVAVAQEVDTTLPPPAKRMRSSASRYQRRNSFVIHRRPGSLGMLFPPAIVNASASATLSCRQSNDKDDETPSGLFGLRKHESELLLRAHAQQQTPHVRTVTLPWVNGSKEASAPGGSSSRAA